MNLQTPLRRCWMKRGQQTRLPAASGPQGFQHVIGALDWQTACVSYTITTVKNSQTFIEFLEHLMVTCYPVGGVVLVMDNAPYHRSAAVQAALAAFEHRLLVFWLPPYCPTLNPIERFWRHLKDIATANKLFPSIRDLLLNLETVLATQNVPDHPLRMSLTRLLS